MSFLHLNMRQWYKKGAIHGVYILVSKKNKNEVCPKKKDTRTRTKEFSLLFKYVFFVGHPV